MMTWVDWLLNGAGLLLWLNWRAIRFRLPSSSSPTSFGALLRPAQPLRSRRYLFLVVLCALLLVRALAYWRVGSQVNWVAAVDLGAVSLPFNSVSFVRMAFYSLTSFGVALVLFYTWLVLLSVVNRSLPDTEVWQRLVRQNLGFLERWPAVFRLAAPMAVVAAFWWVSNPVLVEFGMAAPPVSAGHLAEQAVLAGLGTWLSWKYLIAAVLFLHVLNSYLYLGSLSFWGFVNATARNLMHPLAPLPLRLGRIDFAPVLGLALTWFLFLLAERGLNLLFSRLPL